MIKKFRRIKHNGYTIIETMIAVSLFLVVITIGINSLLNANVVHQKSQDMREEMDNLSFVLEDISRNMRTGYNFHCITAGDFLPTVSMSSPKSCENGWGIAFELSDGTKSDHDDQWVYYIDNNKIFKSTRGPSSLTNFIQLTPDNVVIDDLVAGIQVSGFSVLGAESPSLLPANQQQPFVTIRLVGKIFYKGIGTPFSLQTSVSQRLLDT